jgi:hypothetical protein
MFEVAYPGVRKLRDAQEGIQEERPRKILVRRPLD